MWSTINFNLLLDTILIYNLAQNKLGVIKRQVEKFYPSMKLSVLHDLHAVLSPLTSIPLAKILINLRWFLTKYAIDIKKHVHKKQETEIKQRL